jgi:hypothetical protein
MDFKNFRPFDQVCPTAFHLGFSEHGAAIYVAESMDGIARHTQISFLRSVVVPAIAADIDNLIGIAAARIHRTERMISRREYRVCFTAQFYGGAELERDVFIPEESR